MFISNVKGVPKVVQVGVLVQLGEVDEVWPIVVDQEIEPKPVLPRQREVLDVNMLLSVRSSLTPEQQGLLRRHLLRRLPGSRFVVIDVDLNLLDLETDDDRPDETEIGFSFLVERHEGSGLSDEVWRGDGLDHLVKVQQPGLELVVDELVELEAAVEILASCVHP